MIISAIQCSTEDIGNELSVLFDLPAHWLMGRMNSCCVDENYVFLDEKHYYTVHRV